MALSFLKLKGVQQWLNDCSSRKWSQQQRLQQTPPLLPLCFSAAQAGAFCHSALVRQAWGAVRHS
jgi:hypothetical protein